MNESSKCTIFQGGGFKTDTMIKKHAIVAKISDDIENVLHMCKTHAKRNKKEVLEHNSLKVRTIV